MALQVPFSTAPLLSDPPFAAALALLAAAIGRRALLLAGVDARETGVFARGLIALTLGFGVLQFLPFALGAAHALTPGALRAGLLVLAVLFGRDVWAVLRAAGRALPGALRGRPPWLWAAAAALAVPLVPALFRALCPPTDIDGLYYHLTAPKRWLQAGTLSYLPTLLHTNTPSGGDLLFAIALGVWSDTAAKLVHFTFGLVSLGAIAVLGRRMADAPAGAAGAAAFIIGLPTVSVVALFGYAYVDMMLVAFTVCAALAWLAWRSGGERGWLVVAALLAGFAGTVKLSGLLVAAGLVTATLGWPAEGRDRWRSAAALLALALLPVVPWLVRAWVLTGNPAYPMLAGVFPTRDWSPAASEAFSRFFRYEVWGTGRWSDWTDAQRRILLLAAAALTVGAAGLTVWRVRRAEVRALATACAVMMLLGLWSGGLYLRYHLPVAALALPTVAAVAAGWFSAPGRRVLAVAVACIAALLTVRGGWPPLSRAAAVAAGLESRDRYLARELPAKPLWDRANSVIPSGERVLLAAGRASYYLDHTCYVTETIYQDAIRFASWEGFVSDVQRHGIGYVIVPAETADGQVHMISSNSPREIPFSQRLARERGELIGDAGPDRLYRIDWTGEASRAAKSDPSITHQLEQP